MEADLASSNPNTGGTGMPQKPAAVPCRYASVLVGGLAIQSIKVPIRCPAEGRGLSAGSSSSFGKADRLMQVCSG
jgi:hypothetical protein